MKESKCFYIDFDKLDALLEKKGKTRADLADFLGRDRGWFTQVKKRGGWIDVYTAEAIRQYLGCGAIQEFGEEKSDYFSPVVFDEEKYSEEAEKIFIELKNRGEALYAILDFLKRDEHGFEFLQASIRMREMKAESNQLVGDEWIRVLYMSVLAREMDRRLKKELTLKDHGSYKEQDIRDRFNRLKKKEDDAGRGGLPVYIELLENIVHNRLTEPMECLLEHLLDVEVGSQKTSEFAGMIEVAEFRCAQFIYDVFSGPYSDISVKEQKKLYEQGIIF